MSAPAASDAADAVMSAGVELVAAVPDSLSTPLLEAIQRRDELMYIQAADESAAVCVAAGFTLTGRRALVVMENSGLRRACEALARLGLSHGVHVALLIVCRGAFGEPNWWGLGHHTTAGPLLDALRIRSTEVREPSELAPALASAYAMLDTRETSVAVLWHGGALA